MAQRDGGKSHHICDNGRDAWLTMSCRLSVYNPYIFHLKCQHLACPQFFHLRDDEALQRGVTCQAIDRQKKAAHQIAENDIEDGWNNGTFVEADVFRPHCCIFSYFFAFGNELFV